MPRPRLLEPFEAYLGERLKAHPGLTATRLLRELRERGYQGAYSAVRDHVRVIRPPLPASFEVRFETPAGQQAQVDFAHFRVVFEDEPSASRVVWLFSMVLGHSRLLWARFVAHQDLQTVIRCHMAAFEALGGVPAEILYDRMKTAGDDLQAERVGQLDDRGDDLRARPRGPSASRSSGRSSRRRPAARFEGGRAMSSRCRSRRGRCRQPRGRSTVRPAMQASTSGS